MKNKHIAAHMKSAFNYAECSTAERLKVGCVIVKDDRIISIGYNGMPSGWTNVCDDEDFVTKPEVLHAEENAITKLARSSAMFKYDFENTYNIDTYKRIYMNAHTHGIEPVMHKDDGDFTMLYYPRMDWKPEWGGGTLVDGELIPYVGNSLVVFDAHLHHMAMPVTRECYELRSVMTWDEAYGV